MSRADDLAELRILLEALRLTLARQRAAIAGLDFDELSAATAEERRLSDEIAVIHNAMAARSRTDGVNHTELERQVAETAAKVRAEASANSLLLSDSRQMIAHVLGTDLAPTGYDRRARRSSEPRRSFAKAV